MPYQTTWETNGIYQKFWGQVESPELYDSLRAIFDTPHFDKLQYVLKDYLDIETFDVGVKTIVEGLLLNMKGKRTNPNIIVAVVTTSPDIVEASNAALAYRFDAYPRKLFSTIAEAREWIASLATTPNSSQECMVTQ